MGNAQTSSHSSRYRTKRLGRQRRLSEPDSDINSNKLGPSRGLSSSMATTPTTPPRIQINGMDSMEESDGLAPKSSSMEIPRSASVGTPATLRRMQFLSSSGNLNIRSLDDARGSMTDLQMKPLGRAKSHSPLKQMRTYSYRSLSSEENALDKTKCEEIRRTWQMCLAKTTTMGRDFGYFVFQRIFEKSPILKQLFGLEEDKDLSDASEDHEVMRHTRLFTNIIHLAAKNVDELELQVAPTIFKYGERHFNSKATAHMTEENVRMVCAQVVCTVCDLLADECQPSYVESWIEMMRYLGRKLLDGHEYAKLSSKHHISIKGNDRHLFLML
ncbi:unnamed protein product [Auanema sp. JU1783]|nr:unnamed protein product [Auanema sp. JU1783]